MCTPGYFLEIPSPLEIPPCFATISDVQMWELVRLFEIPPCFATEISTGGVSKNTPAVYAHKIFACGPGKHFVMVLKCVPRCGKCIKAVAKAVNETAGASVHTAKKGSKTFEVTGDFNAAAFISALHANGLHAFVK